MAAAVAGRVDVLRLLLTQRQRVDASLLNARNRYGFTALHLAARRGCEEFVSVLLSAGADPLIRDTYDRTALDEARKHGRHAVCNVLRAATGTLKPAKARMQGTQV